MQAANEAYAHLETWRRPRTETHSRYPDTWTHRDTPGNSETVILIEKFTDEHTHVHARTHTYSPVQIQRSIFRRGQGASCLLGNPCIVQGDPKFSSLPTPQPAAPLALSPPPSAIAWAGKMTFQRLHGTEGNKPFGFSHFPCGVCVPI